MPERLRQEARDHARHRQRGDRDGGEVERDADDCHRAEHGRRDRRGRERGARRGGERPREEPFAQPHIAPAGGRRGAPECRRGQPPAEIEDGPRLDQQDDEAGLGQQRIRIGAPLAMEEQREERGQRRRARAGRGPPEEGDVADGDRRAGRERAAAARAGHPEDEHHPGGDEPDVEPGNGEQVDQARIGEPVAHRGVEPAAGAQHECVHQRSARAVERPRPRGHRIAGPFGKARAGANRIGRRDEQQPAGPPPGASAPHPAPVHAELGPRAGSVAGVPAEVDRSATALPWQRRARETAPGGRVVQPDGQRSAPLRQERRAAAAVRGVRQGRRREPEDERPDGEREGRTTARRHDAEHRDRAGGCAEMQEAGRETGPIEDRNEQGGGRRHRRPSRVRPARPSARSAARPRPSAAPPSAARRSPPGSGRAPG